MHKPGALCKWRKQSKRLRLCKRAASRLWNTGLPCFSLALREGLGFLSSYLKRLSLFSAVRTFTEPTVGLHPSKPALELEVYVEATPCSPQCSPRSLGVCRGRVQVHLLHVVSDAWLMPASEAAGLWTPLSLLELAFRCRYSAHLKSGCLSKKEHLRK